MGANRGEEPVRGTRVVAHGWDRSGPEKDHDRGWGKREVFRRQDLWVTEWVGGRAEKGEEGVREASGFRVRVWMVVPLLKGRYPGRGHPGRVGTQEEDPGWAGTQEEHPGRVGTRERAPRSGRHLCRGDRKRAQSPGLAVLSVTASPQKWPPGTHAPQYARPVPTLPRVLAGPMQVSVSPCEDLPHFSTAAAAFYTCTRYFSCFYYSSSSRCGVCEPPCGFNFHFSNTGQ